MELEQCKPKADPLKGKSGNRRGISCQLPTEVVNWMKENNLSPTLIFKEALREIGCPYYTDEQEQVQEQEQQY
jgi:hypothetical protein